MPFTPHNTYLDSAWGSLPARDEIVQVAPSAWITQIRFEPTPIGWFGALEKFTREYKSRTGVDTLPHHIANPSLRAALWIMGNYPEIGAIRFANYPSLRHSTHITTVMQIARIYTGQLRGYILRAPFEPRNWWGELAIASHQNIPINSIQNARLAPELVPENWGTETIAVIPKMPKIDATTWQNLGENQFRGDPNIRANMFQPQNETAAFLYSGAAPWEYPENRPRIGSIGIPYRARNPRLPRERRTARNTTNQEMSPEDRNMALINRSGFRFELNETQWTISNSDKSASFTGTAKNAQSAIEQAAETLESRGLLS